MSRLFFKDGNVDEYMSVRKIPTQDQIEAADELYKELNAGTSSRHPTGFKKYLLAARNTFNVRNQLMPAFVILAAVIGFQGWYGLSQSASSDNVFGNPLFIISAIGVFVALFSAGMSIVTIVKPLRKLASLFASLQKNPVGTRVDILRNDEIGDIQRGCKSIQIKLGYDIIEAREEAERVMRIQQALGTASSNVMVAEPCR